MECIGLGCVQLIGCPNWYSYSIPFALLFFTSLFPSQPVCEEPPPTCMNGGEFYPEDCECICDYPYSGAQCQGNSNNEIMSGFAFPRTFAK